MPEDSFLIAKLREQIATFRQSFNILDWMLGAAERSEEDHDIMNQMDNQNHLLQQFTYLRAILQEAIGKYFSEFFFHSNFYNSFNSNSLINSFNNDHLIFLKKDNP